VQVMLPLSSRRMLLMTWIDGALPQIVCEAHQVQNINRALAASSDRYLYAHKRCDEISDLAQEFKDSRLNIAIEGGPEKFGPVSVARKLKAGR
jgi:hypothetical protein